VFSSSEKVRRNTRANEEFAGEPLEVRHFPVEIRAIARTAARVSYNSKGSAPEKFVAFIQVDMLSTRTLLAQGQRSKIARLSRP
jgi:hypothetical protein